MQVDPASVSIDDGDSVFIRWPGGEVETVRILGIDTPETRHDEHGIPIAQPFGPEARAFAQGAFAVATEIKMIRASMLDPYGRTLAYLILNGKNYSVLVIRRGCPMRRSASTATMGCLPWRPSSRPRPGPRAASV